MTTSATLTENNSVELGYSQADFLASHSVSPGSAEARAMTVRSGLKCSALLMRPNPAGCLVKTCLESSHWNSTVCLLTWKVSATPRGRLLFQLAPQMPDTEEIEFGLWATMTANDAKGSAYQYSRGDHSKPVLKLTGQARLWPSPTASTGGPEPKGKTGRKLATVVKMFPTPTAQDAKNNGAPAQMVRNTKPLNAEIGGSLNPQFVEWLMGYPIGWTDLKDSATPSSRKSRRN